jgi:S-adenosylmethionine hydrolase
MITLTTDFGLADAFVGTMKGVILSIARQATIVDITHEVPPQDIASGALLLEEAYSYFPEGAIHVCIVDPGVGSSRAALAIQTERYTFVGPDNGLFEPVLARERIVRVIRLSNLEYQLSPVSATFHGRDIFAPAAAHLENGIAVERLGDAAPQRQGLALPAPVRHADRLEIHVLRIDRFGNAITDLTRTEYDMWNNAGKVIRVETGAQTISGLWSTFSDVPRGEAVAYFGSGGRLELAVHGGSAAAELGLTPGAELSVVAS